MRTKLIMAFLALGLTLVVSHQASAEDKALNLPRDPAAKDQIFTPEYLERINTEQQLADSQREKDRIRHQKMLDFYMRHN